MSDKASPAVETKIEGHHGGHSLDQLLSSSIGDPAAWQNTKVAAPLPDAFTKGAGGKGNDLQIVDERNSSSSKDNSKAVDDQIARSIADARAKMSPEQLQHAEAQAAVPYLAIKNAADLKHQEPEQKLTAHAGDTLSHFAARVLHQREGHAPSQAGIVAMAERLAIHNHKSNVNDLKVGEIIRVPRH